VSYWKDLRIASGTFSGSKELSARP